MIGNFSLIPRCLLRRLAARIKSGITLEEPLEKLLGIKGGKVFG